MEKQPLFKELFPELARNNAFAQLVSEKFNRQGLGRKTILLKEDSYVKTIPLVLKGIIKVYKEDATGSEVLLYYIKPGETCIVSVISAEKNRPANVKAVVEEDLEAILIPANELYNLRKNFPEWNLFIYNAFNERFNEVIEMVRLLTFSNKEVLLYDYLIRNTRINKSRIVKKSHQEIAHELGSSREVISRLLKKLEKDGKVSLGLRSVKIV